MVNTRMSCCGSNLPGHLAAKNGNLGMQPCCSASKSGWNFFNMAHVTLHIHYGPSVLQVIVSSARVRLRLDPGKVVELLQGMSAESMGSQFASGAANVLRCLGDLGNLSFTPLPPGVTPVPISIIPCFCAPVLQLGVACVLQGIWKGFSVVCVSFWPGHASAWKPAGDLG